MMTEKEEITLFIHPNKKYHFLTLNTHEPDWIQGLLLCLLLASCHVDLEKSTIHITGDEACFALF